MCFSYETQLFSPFNHIIEEHLKIKLQIWCFIFVPIPLPHYSVSGISPNCNTTCNNKNNPIFKRLLSKMINSIFLYFIQIHLYDKSNYAYNVIKLKLNRCYFLVQYDAMTFVSQILFGSCND